MQPKTLSLASGTATDGWAPPRRPAVPVPSLRTILAAVPSLWLAIFFLAPLLYTVFFSFMTASFGGIDLTFTLDNYRQSLTGFYLGVFLRTILFAVGASAACLLLAYPTAYFMARQPKHRQLLVLLPILVPYFSSFLIRIMSLDMLISRGGVLDWLLQSLHLRSTPLDLLDTPTAVFIGMVYAYLPITVIPLYVVLEKVPTTLLEASRDLGAPPWRTFFAVTLPLSRPGIATAAMMTAVPMLGEMVIPMLLGGSRGLLMGKALSIQYLDSQNYPLGSAMAVLVLVAVGIVVAVLARLTRGFAEMK